MTTTTFPPPPWSRRRSEKLWRFRLVRGFADGVVLPGDRMVAALEALFAPGDRMVLEGNSQKLCHGVVSSGLRRDPEDTGRMRREELVALPEGPGVRRTEASRELLAATRIAKLVAWSGGLYQPPARLSR